MLTPDEALTFLRDQLARVERAAPEPVSIEQAAELLDLAGFDVCAVLVPENCAEVWLGDVGFHVTAGPAGLRVEFLPAA